MGIFIETVEVTNRAPIDLTVTFDGQCKTLTPGKNAIPRMTVEFAKNQNPIMGSGDPQNPHISGTRYLVGVAANGDNVTPLTQAEWEDHLGRPSRTNEEEAFRERYGSDPKARQIVLGKGKPTAANSRYEAGGSPKGISSFEKRE